MLSMTGHGEGRSQNDQIAVRVEIRTVNNRYFKLALRASEGFGSLEPRIEQLVRERVRRGTVQLQVKIDSLSSQAAAIDEQLLMSLYRQFENVHHQLRLKTPIQLEQLVLVPGVVNTSQVDTETLDQFWPAISAALESAITTLNEMRVREGEAMAEDLRGNCNTIREHLGAIEERAPVVVEGHRDRLLERVNRLLEKQQVTVETGDVVREIGLLADRIDISEETVRLNSHLDQFDNAITTDESLGRKLEFLIQEMFRETNTIGSKANDAEIAQRVVEIKSAIERMREMIQNIE